MTTIERLPTDMMNEISGYLSIKELSNFSQSSKKIHSSTSAKLMLIKNQIVLEATMKANHSVKKLVRNKAGWTKVFVDMKEDTVFNCSTIFNRLVEKNGLNIEPIEVEEALLMRDTLIQIYKTEKKVFVLNIYCLYNEIVREVPIEFFKAYMFELAMNNVDFTAW